MPWLTPDYTPGNVDCYRVYLPDNDELRAAFLGAFLQLAEVWNWEEFGSSTPEEISNEFAECFARSESLEKCSMIGAIIWSAGGTYDNALACDGSQYNTADYPELFNQIGFTWGGSGAVFNVPNLVNRFAIGSGGDVSLAGTGGEKTHTLSSGEMPSHFHFVSGVTFLPVQAGAGSFALSLAPGSNYATGSEGGGGAHNNLPPYVGLNPFIVYR